jgi:SP family general alpha glucoside:H+ symporter-like MFS transporter
MLSWILTTYLGRRTIYVWGSAFNTFLLIMLGVAATVPVSSAAAKTAASLAQASLGLIISVLFTLGPAPASWVIIGETSSIRLRPLTTGIGRGCYYIVNIPCIFLSSWMLNPDVRSSRIFPAQIAEQLLTCFPQSADLGGKCGYVWGGTGLFCFVVAYFYLPEMKGRSYREIDILFNRKVPARQWKKTVIDVQDDH